MIMDDQCSEDEETADDDDAFLDAIFPRTLLAMQSRSDPVGYNRWLLKMLTDSNENKKAR